MAQTLTVMVREDVEISISVKDGCVEGGGNDGGSGDGRI